MLCVVCVYFFKIYSFKIWYDTHTSPHHLRINLWPVVIPLSSRNYCVYLKLYYCVSCLSSSSHTSTIVFTWNSGSFIPLSSSRPRRPFLFTSFFFSFMCFNLVSMVSFMWTHKKNYRWVGERTGRTRVRILEKFVCD